MPFHPFHFLFLLLYREWLDFVKIVELCTLKAVLWEKALTSFSKQIEPGRGFHLLRQGHVELEALGMLQDLLSRTMLVDTENMELISDSYQAH